MKKKHTKERQARNDENDISTGGSGTNSSNNGTQVNKSNKKKGYAGGKVLEPERGFYSDWIALLDFTVSWSS